MLWDSLLSPMIPSDLPHMARFPALTGFPSVRAMRDWNYSLSMPLSLGERPQSWPGSPTASQVVSVGYTWDYWAPPWCRPSLTEQLGWGGGSLRAELALVAGVDLWSLPCGLPAPSGSPSLSPHTGPWLQPCKLPSPWTLVPGRPCGSSCFQL